MILMGFCTAFCTAMENAIGCQLTDGLKHILQHMNLTSLQNLQNRVDHTGEESNVWVAADPQELQLRY